MASPLSVGSRPITVSMSPQPHGKPSAWPEIPQMGEAQASLFDALVRLTRTPMKPLLSATLLALGLTFQLLRWQDHFNLQH